MGTALDIVKFGWPPRAVFMDFPLGHGGGPLFDPDRQLAIARQAMAAFESIRSPGEIVALEQTWPEGDAWKTGASDDAGDDVRQPRDLTVRYQREEDRQLAEQRAEQQGGPAAGG